MEQREDRRGPGEDEGWTIVDSEMESCIQGLENMDVGISLLNEHSAMVPVSQQSPIESMYESCPGPHPPIRTAEAQDALEAELSELRMAMAMMQDKVRERENEISALRAEVRNVRAENAGLTHRTQQLKEVLEKYAAEKEALERCAVTVESTHHTSVAFVSGVVQRLTDLAQHVSSMRRALSDEDAKAAETLPHNSFATRTLESAVLSLETGASELEGEVWALEATQRDVRRKGSSEYKISLTSFSVGEIALFFPTPRGDLLAFNASAPHHYLSEESKALIGQDKHFRKFYVLGKIVYIEELRATATNNPFKLQEGTKYKLVSVTSITRFIERD